MTTVYVVMGNCGVADEYRNWFVCAYPSEERAAEHVRRARAWLQKHVSRDMDPSEYAHLVNPCDPDNKDGADPDADWEYAPVDMRETVPVAEGAQP